MTGPTACLATAQTIGIGGLILENEEQRNSGVPLLGRIPVLGRLFFRSSRGFMQNTELIIFITPRILPPHAPDADARRRQPGVQDDSP